MPPNPEHAAQRLLLADALTYGRLAERWCAANVEEVFGLAEEHATARSLAGLVLGRADASPAWRQRARAEWIDATRQSELALQETIPVLARLAQAGVRALVIKGAALRLAVGLPAGLRHSEDVDLWIDPRGADAATRVFDALGLAVAPWISAPAFSGRTRGESMRASFHQLPDRRLPSGCYLDPNLRLWGVDPNPMQTFDSVWERRRCERIAGSSVAVPALDDQLWVLTAHAVLHHALQPAMFTRHIADWQVLLRSGATVTRAQALAPSIAARVAVALTEHAVARISEAVDRHDNALLPGLFAPSSSEARRWLTRASRLESCRGLGRDIAERPGALRYKIWPDDRWMRHALGLGADAPLPRAARIQRLLGRPWRPSGAPSVEG